ncbi:hypothetical protein HZH68_003005 [Vespula germanica]|uniref:Uncharacterized protein n=1 Tax=Vespula germanica TaxID=30212 RepID=A0A834NNA4_VESGE|nr:hypothetical protein HZH68_003005 [Vespula germanica]
MEELLRAVRFCGRGIVVQRILLSNNDNDNNKKENDEDDEDDEDDDLKQSLPKTVRPNGRKGGGGGGDGGDGGDGGGGGGGGGLSAGLLRSAHFVRGVSDFASAAPIGSSPGSSTRKLISTFNARRIRSFRSRFLWCDLKSRGKKTAAAAAVAAVAVAATPIDRFGMRENGARYRGI